jgi:hypothetical protein
MEATCSSEMLIDFERTTQHYNQEDRDLDNQSCEDLRFYLMSREFVPHAAKEKTIATR